MDILIVYSEIIDNTKTNETLFLVTIYKSVAI